MSSKKTNDIEWQYYKSDSEGICYSAYRDEGEGNLRRYVYCPGSPSGPCWQRLGLWPSHSVPIFAFDDMSVSRLEIAVMCGGPPKIDE